MPTLTLCGRSSERSEHMRHPTCPLPLEFGVLVPLALRVAQIITSAERAASQE